MATKILETTHPLTKQGTVLPCGGRTYQFSPNGRGHYVAEVLEVDVPTVLSISAGYRLYKYQHEALPPSHDIVFPEPPREPAARAIPQSPRKRGRPPKFGNKAKAAETPTE